MTTPDRPVTEFALLNLVAPTTLESLELISGMLAGTSAQSSWSGRPVHLFYETKKPEGGSSAPSTSVYLISGWASVDAHNEWIASSENQEIMRSFQDAELMTFGGLAHLDIDFTDLSFQECSTIVWRRLARRDGGDEREADEHQGRGLHPTSGSIKLIPSSIVASSKSRMDERSVLKPMAEALWSYRGRAVDEGATDEYELTGYSEGQLGELDERLNVIRRWNPQG